MKIHTQLVTYTIGIIILICFAFGLHEARVLQIELSSQYEQRTKQLLSKASESLAPYLQDFRLESIQETIREITLNHDLTYIQVYDKSGNLITESAGSYFHNQPPLQTPDNLKQSRKSGLHQLLKSDEFYTATQPIYSTVSTPLASVTIHLSREEEYYQTYRRIYQIAIFTGALIIFGSLIAAYFAHRILSPLRKLQNSIHEWEEGRLIATPNPTHSRPNEIGDLEKAFWQLVATRQKVEYDLRRSRNEMKKAKTEAEAAAKAKTDFLANMSHEIRTPLNGLIGIADILIANDPRPDQRELLVTAHASGESLLQIVNDLLDLSRIEAGWLGIHPCPMSVREVVDQAMHLFIYLINEKKLHPEIIIDPEVPDWIIADPKRIRQILHNLISNAIKFTPAGNITIQAGVLTNEEHELFLRISITDTGIGIPQNKLTSIFGRFNQVDSTISRDFGGTGLGLSICAELVHLMRGKIHAISELEKGSTFTFQIPVIPGTKPVDKPTNAINALLSHPIGRSNGLKHLKRAHVLVVEDNKVNQTIVKLILNKLSINTTIASSGEEAIRMYQEFKYDIIFMDVQMPGIDGIETTKRIRSIAKETNHNPTIIALTAHSMEADRKRCYEAGMDGYLTKPITHATVESTLEQLNKKPSHI